MSNKSIKMSKKYGVNPAIPICFFCQKEKNEVALLGHIGDGRKGEDIEAPKNVFLDYEPCDACKEQMAQGVTLIEVSGEPAVRGLPPIKDKHYPTGRWGVVSREYADAMFYVEVPEKAFVDEEVYEAVFHTKEGTE